MNHRPFLDLVRFFIAGHEAALAGAGAADFGLAGPLFFAKRITPPKRLMPAAAMGSSSHFIRSSPPRGPRHRSHLNFSWGQWGGSAALVIFILTLVTMGYNRWKKSLPPPLPPPATLSPAAKSRTFVMRGSGMTLSEGTRVATLLWSFLQQRMGNPALLDLKPGDNLYKIFLAYATVALQNDRTTLFKTAVGDQHAAFAGVGISNATPGAEPDQVFVNSTYFGPLLERAQSDPFYADCAMLFIIKEGTALWAYNNPIDKANLMALSEFADGFENKPFTPRTSNDLTSLEIHARGLIETEYAGYEAAHDWARRRNLTRARIQEKRAQETDPALSFMLTAIDKFLNPMSGRSRPQAELVMKVRILATDLALVRPHMAQTLLNLPGVKQLPKDGDGYPQASRAVFYWLVRPDYKVLGTRTPLAELLKKRLAPETGRLLPLNRPLLLAV